MRKITKKAVINELAAIAFSDFGKYVTVSKDENGQQLLIVSDYNALDKDCRRALCSAKTGTKGIEIKLHDKLKALELLGKMFGLFSSCADAEERDAVEMLKRFLDAGKAEAENE